MPKSSSTPDSAQAPQAEAALFAPTPIWARDAKARRKARAAAAPARTDPAMDAAEAGAMGAPTAAEPADAAYETQSLGGGRRSGPSRAALGAGVAVAAILAAAGWYAASRSQHGGLAQLTPGASATQPPSAEKLPVTQLSDRTTVPTNPSPPDESTPPRTRRHRTPGANGNAPSALDSAIDASTTVAQTQTPATATGAAPMTQPTDATPPTATTGPAAPASTPSADPAEPGASPAATPAPATTP